ncbi:MAG: hemerythrin domain-containing protein [Pirellulaceae bacterium]|nr:hemerythrin domain-containing protein [Pirellulaceae bacterium]
MPLQLNGKMLAGFDQPIEMLCDCHRRVEYFLDVQLRIAERYQHLVLDQEARAALENARAYFLDSAPKHTADEEDSLFPRLLSSSSVTKECQQALRRLEDDHLQANRMHFTIDAILAGWLGSDDILPKDVGEHLVEQLRKLRDHYREHIRIEEEEEVFPYAGQTLPDNQLLEVGKEMRARRRLDQV